MRRVAPGLDRQHLLVRYLEWMKGNEPPARGGTYTWASNVLSTRYPPKRLAKSSACFLDVKQNAG